MPYLKPNNSRMLKTVFSPENTLAKKKRLKFSFPIWVIYGKGMLKTSFSQKNSVALKNA